MEDEVPPIVLDSEREQSPIRRTTRSDSESPVRNSKRSTRYDASSESPVRRESSSKRSKRGRSPKGRYEVKRRQPHLLPSNDVVTYFITNIPIKCSPLDICMHFTDYETYITNVKMLPGYGISNKNAIIEMKGLTMARREPNEVIKKYNYSGMNGAILRVSNYQNQCRCISCPESPTYYKRDL